MGRSRSQGASLVEVCILLGVVGVALAAFVPTFLDRLRTSKTAEAVDHLRTLHQGTAAYWTTPFPAGTRCLPAPAGPVPSEPSTDPAAVDFAGEETPGAATFRALGFAPEDGVRYRYTVDPAASGCGLGKRAGAELVAFRAEGDLDGDGTLSRFERLAGMAEDGSFVPIGVLYLTAPLE